MSEKENMEYKPEVKVEGEQDQERRHVVTFKRPYLFERKEYAEVDLSGLDELTVKDAIEVQKQLFGQQEVAASLLTETTTAFAQALAVRASGKPVEFFKLMKKPFYRPVFRYVREYVMSTEKGVENHVMQLEKPYFFQGKEYREIDLNGVADMNSMQESAAETAWRGRALWSRKRRSTTCTPASLPAWQPDCRRSSLRVCRSARSRS